MSHDDVWRKREPSTSNGKKMEERMRKGREGRRSYSESAVITVLPVSKYLGV